MSIDSLRLRPQTMTGLGWLVRGIFFFLVLVLGGAIIAYYNYWWGVVFLFVALLVSIMMLFKPYQGRNLWLLVLAHFLAILVLLPFVFSFLLNAPMAQELAASNATANFMWGTDEGALLSGIVFSIFAALIIAVIFCLVVATATIIILKWDESGEISFFQAFLYLVRSILGIGPFFVYVDGGELKGKAEDIRLLENFGGPGWLIVHPGYAVVLLKQGKITRAVGLGSTFLKPEEKIRAILPLAPQGNIQKIENALTRDRISLDLIVLHAARIEPAADTKARLQQAVVDARESLQSIMRGNGSPSPEEIETAQQAIKEAQQKLEVLDQDKIIGDGYDQCYESMVKLVAMRAPTDIWGAVKFPVANNTKDAFMSEYSEDLFSIGGDGLDLASRINQRKIKEIEALVVEKATVSGLDKGVRLLLVDIQEVHFPKEVKEKIEEEVKTLIQERIQQTEARIAEFKAKATVIEARAEAQARMLEGQGEGEAQAALFREIIRELRRENVLTDQEIANALLQMISATVSVKELQSFFKATARPRVRLPEETNGSEGD